MGEAKGILPGRVVWVHDANAVNQNCVVDAAGHGWFLRENNNQAVIDDMVSAALRNLTGQTSDRAAWDAIFRYHNATRGKGTVGYTRGEKVFIKINATSAYAGNFNPSDLTPYAFVSETSVGTVLTVLRQLVGVVGVDQGDIYVGDPLKHIYKHLYDVWHGEFPNVHYLDNSGYSNLGREPVVPSTTAVIHYSDRGAILRTNVWSDNYPGDNPVYQDNLYTIFRDAEYMINIPMLKGHKRAGVTMFAKNHFGSQTRGDASHLHNGLVAPTEMPNVSRGGYGLYRVQVDIMGHSLLGKKNLFYLLDALWATDYELDVPIKWQMAPFANTYMASVFASLDPVAIESVGYDFLRSEFTADRVPAAGTYVQMTGVDDYLHQAADAANWPSGVAYDPDNTGVPITSLGTHEHWNNASARQYSRNLGPAGTGIELIQADHTIRTQAVVDQTVALGGAATFAAVATGSTPLTYQWQRRTSGSATWATLSDNATYSGSGTASLTVHSVVAAMDGDSFSCVLTSANGTATTSPAALVVDAPFAVVTLAGAAGSSGVTDGSGSAARFANPTGVAVELAGNLYVADTDNHTIRKIAASTGAVTTLAGLAGRSGSADGTGSAAKFNSPSGVAVDGAGNVYVADTLNHAIRKVGPTGVVTTLAGLSGSHGSTDGTGSAARFWGPQGLAMDSGGNLYVADTNNDLIRRIATATGVVTTVAGSAGSSGSADGIGAQARFNGPSGVAVDGAGNLYVADLDNHTVRAITPAGVVSTLAGLAGASGSADGTGGGARFNSPSDVAVDGSGNVYVADTGNQTIRRIAVAVGAVTTPAGLAGTSGSADGVGQVARFYRSAGIAVDTAGTVYVADTNNQTIRLSVLPVVPGIQTQPQSQAVTAGNSVQFSVTASGRPAIAYQWYVNGSAISGATGSAYGLASAQSGNAGSYTVVISNVAGQVTSDRATLTVNAATSPPPSGGGGGGGGGAIGAWFCGALLVLVGVRALCVNKCLSLKVCWHNIGRNTICAPETPRSGRQILP
jgi:sugar lactone lactonase YvrE